MGVNLSKNEYKAVYDQSTNIMTQFLNTQVTNISTNQNALQKITINMNNVKCHGDLGAIQTMENTASAVYQLSTQNDSTMTNQLATQLTDTIKNTLSQTNTGLANLFQANANQNSTNIEQTIKTNILTSIHNAVTQNFSTDSSNVQAIAFNIENVEADNCVFSQDMVIKQFVNATLNNITNSLVANASDVKSTNTATNDTTQFNQGVGLGGLLGFGNLGAFGDVIVIIGVVAVVGGIGAMVVKKKNKK